MPIAFTLNGRPVTLDAAPTRLLLDILRNDLALPGTRYGCGAEQCGACAVLVDGTPAYACGRELGTVAGKSVTTVEGLGTQEAPSRLQQAFLAEQAGQCGYCLSGMLIAATALLASNPTPSQADIIAALDPHLCRCGAHPRILRAVARAAEARQ
jgi:nicotinate dehydrogenase subunit A